MVTGAIVLFGCGRVGFVALPIDGGGRMDSPEHDAGPRDSGDLPDTFQPDAFQPVDAGPEPYAGPRFVAATDLALTTSSGPFVAVPGGSITFTPGSADDAWVVLLSGELLSTEIAQRVLQVRYLINDVERGIGEQQNEVPGNPTPWAHFDVVTGTTEPQTVRLELSATSGAATIRNGRIIAFPLPVGADLHFAEELATRLVPGGDVWTAGLELAFTPVAAGDYLVLSVVNASEEPTSTSVAVRMVDGSAMTWSEPPMGNNRQFWIPIVFARSLRLNASAQRLAFEGRSLVSGSLRYARIAAFRLDGFDRAQTVEDPAGVVVDTSALTTTSTLVTDAPPTTRDHIVLQCVAVAGATDDPMLMRGRVTELRLDGTAQAGVVRYNTSDSALGSDCVFTALATDRSFRSDNAVATTEPARPVVAFESVIHVLRLHPR